jgi:hypothetical protein
VREAALEAEEELLAHGVDLEISEEDGYCKIDLEGEGEGEGEGAEEEPEGQGGYYGNTGEIGDDDEDVQDRERDRDREESDEFRDDISVLTDFSRQTSMTSQTSKTTTTTTIRAPAANAKIPSTSLPSTSSTTEDPLKAVNEASQQVLSSLLDQGSSMLSSLWSVANRQNVVDLTLAGIQKVKTVSQDIFANTNNSSSDANVCNAHTEENTGSSIAREQQTVRSSSQTQTQTHAHSQANKNASVHLELDKEIRRPILTFQCTFSSLGSDNDKKAFSVSSSSTGEIAECNRVCGRNGDGQGRNDIAVSLIYMHSVGSARSSTASPPMPMPMSNPAWEEMHSVAAAVDEIDGYSRSMSTRQQQQPQQQSYSQDRSIREELKMIIATKDGLLRK